MSRLAFAFLVGWIVLPTLAQPTISACNSKDVLASVNQLIERQLFSNTCGPSFKITFNKSHITSEIKTLREIDKKTSSLRACQGTVQVEFNRQTQAEMYRLSEAIKPVAEKMGNSEKFNLARYDRIELINKPINYVFSYEISRNLMTEKDMISFTMQSKYETQLYCGIYEEFLAGGRLINEVQSRR